MPKLAVLHIITGLDTGGAEWSLLRLLNELPPSVSCKVIVLAGRGALSDSVNSRDLDIQYLHIKRASLPSLRTLIRLIKISREFEPDIIQGWMYHANIAAWFVRIFLTNKPKLVWNIRQTLSDLAVYNLGTRFIIRVSSMVATAADSIIYNSRQSVLQHVEIGYPSGSARLIFNGFDLDYFKPKKASSRKIRKNFGIASDSPLIIHVARYHPMKDHVTLLRALKLIRSRFHNIRAILVGSGVSTENAELYELCCNLDLLDVAVLLGERHDVSDLIAASDLALTTSAWGEGFPNVIGEALSCGVPCVATDVGESRFIIGNCGRLVQPGNPEAFYIAVSELLSDEKLRSSLGEMARERMRENFSLDRMVSSYFDLYQETVA